MPVSVRPAGRRGRLRRALAVTAGVAVVAVLGAGGWIRYELAGSLPRLDGRYALTGLTGPITVDRDLDGVPTIRGRSRIDVARATGFVHAQERFFQMDLSRRQAAGELSALIGPQTLDADRAARLHRMRAHAADAVAAASPGERALLEAYVAGVNAGLRALRTLPFEYLLLRVAPAPWTAEDSVLVLASMFFSLQESTAARESRVALTEDLLPPPLASFLLAPAGDWEAPIAGGLSPRVPVPGADVINLRSAAAGARAPAVRPAGSGSPLAWLAGFDDEIRGSNNWALSGAHTANGAALVADDMHLRIAVPNTWFRASFEWVDAAGAHRVTGVTLPGVPSVVVGSNGALAWGFTNATGDFSDLVLIDPDPRSPDRYLTPDGSQEYVRHRETLAVRGGTSAALDVRETIWGPIVDTDHRGRQRAVCWVPARPGGMNLRLFALETASTIDGVFAIAHDAGIPAQNLVVGDRNGRIAWTIAGRIPRRVEGFDGRVPASWSDGTRGWAGWLASDAYPRVVDPPSGRLWTANNRLVDGDMLRTIGDGGFDLGARARQIREDLQPLERATPADMLRVHLDDRAVFLTRWRDLALRTLTPAAVAGHAARREFRRLIDTTWTGRASVESAAYRLVRAFRLEAATLALRPLLAPALSADRRPATTVTAWVRTIEAPVWTLVSEQPPHLLDPAYASWSDVLLAAIDRTCEVLTVDGGRLADRTWGEANTARIGHPLAAAIPMAGTWLNMPGDPLPGDSNMPRVQSPSGGASERLAVSPGHEADGYFHMPGGQSGHPLSPYYRRGHAAWVAGTPTPFLPGPAASTLILEPR